ncbi:ectoine hydroxylase [Paenibacillus piri]|uniref:Ectoine hydroxylase n=1 Tax=Paenibacillus piri TaxID=2547395 RepID=A0A4R5KNI0_9BACL|nr:ectoine hydroxylase [Paenibacillus piri]TDF97201.1 ectoine hydroxylase [Paenibacillus piri]
MPRINHATQTEEIADLYPSRIKAEPEWIQRKDPVVYSAWAQQTFITEQQSDFYKQNGYLFIEQFFSAEEIAAYKDELNRLWNESLHSKRDEVIREPDSEEVRSIFAVHSSSDVFKALAGHPRLKRLTDYLLGSSTYIHQSRINFKPGFTGKEFYWHSDFETWHVEDGMPRMRALSCSIALEDNYPFNGPLMVVPGSHMTYISCVGKTPERHYQESLRRQQYGVPDQDSLTELVRKHGIHTPVGKAGSIVLFDCNIMHGSNSNISPMPRSNVFLVYNSVDNRLQEPFSGQTPRPEYIAAR